MYRRHLPRDIQWRRRSCKGEGQYPKSQQGVSDDQDLCLGHMTYWELSPGIPPATFPIHLGVPWCGRESKKAVPAIQRGWGEFDTDRAKEGLDGGLRLQQSWKWKTQMGERGALPNHSTPPTPAICSLEHVSLGWGAAAWGSEGSRCGGFSRRHSHCAHPWTPQPPPGVHEGSLKACRARTCVSALVTLALLQNLSPSDSLGPETNGVL